MNYYSAPGIINKILTFDYVMDTVCAYYSQTIDEIMQVTRKREIVQTRQIVHYFCRKFKLDSLDSIAAKTGNKDHSTVCHSIKTIKNLIDTDKKISKEIKEICYILQN